MASKRYSACCGFYAGFVGLTAGCTTAHLLSEEEEEEESRGSPAVESLWGLAESVCTRHLLHRKTAPFVGKKMAHIYYFLIPFSFLQCVGQLSTWEQSVWDTRDMSCLIRMKFNSVCYEASHKKACYIFVGINPSTVVSIRNETCPVCSWGGR